VAGLNFSAIFFTRSRTRVNQIFDSMESNIQRFISDKPLYVKNAQRAKKSQNLKIPSCSHLKNHWAL